MRAACTVGAHGASAGAARARGVCARGAAESTSRNGGAGIEPRRRGDVGRAAHTYALRVGAARGGRLFTSESVCLRQAYNR